MSQLKRTFSQRNTSDGEPEFGAIKKRKGNGRELSPTPLPSFASTQMITPTGTTNTMAVAPLKPTPPEILLPIFQLATSCSASRDPVYALVLLTWVCRLWRDVALGNPLLWTNVHITSRLPLIEHLFLGRSNGLPLTLHAHRRFPSIIQRKFMRYVLPHISRIRGINLVDTMHTSMSAGLPVVTPTFTESSAESSGIPPSFLRRLVIYYSIDGPGAGDTIELYRQLNLDDDEQGILEWSAIGWALPYLSTHLVELSFVAEIDADAFRPDPAEWLKALSLTPSLSSLRLEGCFGFKFDDVETPSYGETVFLKKLQSLRLRGDSAQCFWLMKHVEFPAGTNVSITLEVGRQPRVGKHLTQMIYLVGNLYGGGVATTDTVSLRALYLDLYDLALGSGFGQIYIRGWAEKPNDWGGCAPACHCDQPHTSISFDAYGDLSEDLLEISLAIGFVFQDIETLAIRGLRMERDGEFIHSSLAGFISTFPYLTRLELRGMAAPLPIGLVNSNMQFGPEASALSCLPWLDNIVYLSDSGLPSRFDNRLGDFGGEFSDEVLLRIFQFASSDHDENDVVLAVGTVTWVCRRWREIALNNPFLWTSINITQYVALVALFFERSEQLPLTLHAHQHTPPYISKKFMDLILPHMSRFQDIEVFNVASLYMQPCPRPTTSSPDSDSEPSITKHTSSNLRRLNITYTRRFYLDVESVPQDLPSPVIWVLPWFSGNLVELSIVFGHVWIDKIAFDLWLDILAYAPSLRILRLKGCLAELDDDIGPKYPVRTPTCLKNLETLYLKASPRNCAWLIGHLEFPSTTAVSVVMDGFASGSAYRFMINLMREKLYDADVTWSNDDPTAASAPHLRVLSFEVGTNTPKRTKRSSLATRVEGRSDVFNPHRWHGLLGNHTKSNFSIDGTSVSLAYEWLSGLLTDLEDALPLQDVHTLVFSIDPVFKIDSREIGALNAVLGSFIQSSLPGLQRLKLYGWPNTHPFVLDASDVSDAPSIKIFYSTRRVLFHSFSWVRCEPERCLSFLNNMFGPGDDDESEDSSGEDDECGTGGDLDFGGEDQANSDSEDEDVQAEDNE